jgi:MEMO1 family protein
MSSNAGMHRRPVRCSNFHLGGGIVCGVLMPHAPILIPDIAGSRQDNALMTISAMREAARVMIAADTDTLIVVSPHSPGISNPIGIWGDQRLYGSLTAFGFAHLAIDLPADLVLADSVASLSTRRGLNAVSITECSLDHGATVPLWFAAEAGWNGPTVVVTLNSADQQTLLALGETIAEAARSTNRRVTLIASGDMSHRLAVGAPLGYDPRGQEFDNWLVDVLRRGAYRDLFQLDPQLDSSAAQDVIAPLLVVFAALGFSAAEGEVLSYEGPFGVGYSVAILYREVSRIDKDGHVCD